MNGELSEALGPPNQQKSQPSRKVPPFSETPSATETEISQEANPTLREAPSPPTPESSSPTAELINEIRKADESLGNFVVTRFPRQEQGDEVLIFDARVLYPGGLSTNPDSAAGIHPELGPIIIKTSELGKQLRRIIAEGFYGKRPGTDVEWNSLLESLRQKAMLKEDDLRMILPQEQNIWNETMKNSIRGAGQRQRYFQIEQQVTSNSLEAVKNAVQETLKSPTQIASETPSMRTTPLEAPRQQAPISETPTPTETPEGLRPVPPSEQSQ